MLYAIVSKFMGILADTMTGIGLLALIGMAILFTDSWIWSESSTDGNDIIRSAGTSERGRDEV